MAGFAPELRSPPSPPSLVALVMALLLLLLLLPLLLPRAHLGSSIHRAHALLPALCKSGSSCPDVVACCIAHPALVPTRRWGKRLFARWSEHASRSLDDRGVRSVCGTEELPALTYFDVGRPPVGCHARRILLIVVAFDNLRGSIPLVVSLLSQLYIRRQRN